MSGSSPPVAGTPTPTNRRIAGVTSITIDGSSFNVISFNWSPSKRARETMKSLSGVDGYRELPQQGHIEAVLRDAQSISVGAFWSKTSSTVVVNQADGKQIVGHDMWIVDVQTVDGAEATFGVKFEGDTVSELNVASA